MNKGRAPKAKKAVAEGKDKFELEKLATDDLAKSGLRFDVLSKRGEVRLADASELVRRQFSLPPGHTVLGGLLLPYPKLDSSGNPIKATANDFTRAKIFYGPQPTTGWGAALDQDALKAPPKYLQPPGSGVQLYPPRAYDWAAFSADVALPLFIVEGEKKALALVQRGVPCVALGGVDSIRDSVTKKLLPALASLAQGRDVYIVFDIDVGYTDYKREVKTAAHRLADELKKNCESRVFYVKLQSDGEAKVAADDWVQTVPADADVMAELRKHVDLTEDLWTPIYALEEMIDRFAFIPKGKYVVKLGSSCHPITVDEFRLKTAASVHWEEDKADGKAPKKPTPIADLWLRHRARKTVDGITWHPDHPEITSGPISGPDAPHVNRWTGRPKPPPPKDWKQRAKPFVEHVEYLVPIAEERRRFLQFLAHIEQQPGQLPHASYLLRSPTKGTGRSWMGNVLTEVFKGYTAPDFDLQLALGTKFNEALSEKLLAIVGEVYVGGKETYQQSNALRSLITDSVRTINTKYGAMQLQFNCCRFLMFTNHVDAIPFNKGERRFYVIAGPEKTREAAYYTRLYSLLKDQLFIASVREYLSQLDIGDFNPGAHPPENEAIREMRDAVKSEMQRAIEEVIRDWPGEVIASMHLSRILLDQYQIDTTSRAASAFGHAAIDAGLRSLPGRISLDNQRKSWTYRLAKVELNGQPWINDLKARRDMCCEALKEFEARSRREEAEDGKAAKRRRF